MIQEGFDRNPGHAADVFGASVPKGFIKARPDDVRSGSEVESDAGPTAGAWWCVRALTSREDGGQ